VIADPYLPAFENPAADTPAPFGRKRSSKATVRGLHQMTGLGLLGDFQNQISNSQLATFLGRHDTFDEKIGPARHPRKRDAKLTAGAFPALPEKDRDLAAGSSASGVAADASEALHLSLLDLDKGSPQGRGAGYSQQNSHIFTSIILQLVMN